MMTWLDAQVADGRVFVVEQHFQNIGAEQVFIGQIALRPVAEDVLDEQRVVVGQGVDKVEDFAAAGVAEVSDQPEVDEGDAAVVVDEDVARMGVGMEKPCRSIMVKRVSVIRPASPLRKEWGMVSRSASFRSVPPM